jgi:hypothetical protein
LSSDEDDEDDEVLAPQTPLASTKGDVSGSVPAPLMFAMMRRHHQSLTVASLLILLLQEMRKAGYRWVAAAAPVVSQFL